MAIKNNTSQNPTYTFAGNTEMGMFPAGPNKLGFATNSETGAILDESANFLVTGSIYTSANLTVTGDTDIGSGFRVGGDAFMSSGLYVTGNVGISQDLNVTGDINLAGDAYLFGDATISSNLRVTGTTNLIGDAYAESKLYVAGDTYISSSLGVTGNITGESVFERTKTLEELSHKTLELTELSTDIEYPSAKAAYDFTVESTLFCGVYDLPTLTDNGDGTITLGDGQFVFAADAIGTPPRQRFAIPGATYSLVDNAFNIILADLNGGNPILISTTSNATVNNQTVFPVFGINRVGTSLDIIDLDHDARGLPNKILLRLARTQRFQPEPNGNIIGTSSSPAVRTLTITAGRIWYSATSTLLPVFNSGSDSFSLLYHSAGVWTSAAATQLNNTQYDDGTNLQTLTNNRYAVCFIYRAIGYNVNKSFMILGQGDYSLGQAQTAVPPSSLPQQVLSALFVGRIIIEKNSDTVTQVDSAFVTQFALSGVTDHESLSNLQGGSANDHSHVTAVERTYLQGLQVAISTSGLNVILNGTNSTAPSQTLDSTSSLVTRSLGDARYMLEGTATVTGTKTFTSTIQLQNTDPAIWLDETDGATPKGLRAVLFNNDLILQRRDIAFGASEANVYSFNMMAPSSSLVVNSSGDTILGGTNNTAPSQTLTSSSSLVTRSLGDARYSTLADNQTITGQKLFTAAGGLRSQNTLPSVWLDETDGATPKGVTLRVSSNVLEFARMAINFGATEAVPYKFNINAPANSFICDSSGNIVVGSSSPSARIHSNSSTEQLRLSYNDTFYASLTINSTSALIVGGNSNWTFSNPTTFTNQVDVLGHYRSTSSTPGLWLDMGTTAKSCYIVLFGGSLQIQRRAAGFEAFEATIMNLNLAAPNGSFAMDSAGRITMPNGILGITDGSSAGAGEIGQYITSSVLIANAVAATSNVSFNVTSISLPAGDWDVQGHVTMSYTTATVTQMTAGINSTSATLPSSSNYVQSGLRLTSTTFTNSVTIPANRFSLTSTTTIYLVGHTVFSAGSAEGFGRISARRIR